MAQFSIETRRIDLGFTVDVWYREATCFFDAFQRVEGLNACPDFRKLDSRNSATRRVYYYRSYEYVIIRTGD